MTNNENDAPEVAKRLKLIVGYVRDCQVRVAKGEVMDLQGLDKNVISVCDAVAQLPTKESQALESQMTQLIDSLEGLAHTMKDQQDRYAAAGGK